MDYKILKNFIFKKVHGTRKKFEKSSNEETTRASSVK